MPDTRFKPGQSGNPKGRPRRPRLKSVRELLGANGLQEVVEAMKTAAKAGDAQAAKLLIPALKPEMQRVTVPEIEAAATPTEKAAAIAAAAARGEISPDAAVALSTALANSVKVAEGDELRRQVEDLAKLVKERLG